MTNPAAPVGWDALLRTPSPTPPASAQGSKNFFFEKKKQKTFILSGLRALTPTEAQRNQKFFASFFQKRSSSFPFSSMAAP
jgi:hypothetical protein